LPGKRPWKNMRTFLRQYFAWEEALKIRKLSYDNILPGKRPWKNM